jgi:aminopeptidase
MADPRIDKLAHLLVNYSTKVKPGEWVLVSGNVVAVPLIEAITREIIRAGGNPTTLLSTDNLGEIRLRESSDEQLEWISPMMETVVDKMDVFLTIWGTENTRSLTNIDPARQQVSARSQRSFLEKFRERRMRGEIRWCGTQFPTLAFAQEADMSLSEYENFVYGATFADQDDPVKNWLEIHDQQQKLVDWLAGKKEVVVRGPNADLTLSIDGRTFINSDGKQNMPSGEIFTSPVEDSANGWVNYDYPAIRGGREVEGVRLEFKDGKVVKASATKNEDYLLSQLELDEGASILGEFAIGTNYGIQKFTKSILFDEKIGGTMHMAVGNGFPEAGGQNKSVLHWDFICGMQNDSEILVDGELLYKNGEFQIAI